MLVAFPTGLWVFSLVCDLIRFSGGNTAWSTVALYSLAGGIVGAIIAAVPGLIDYFSIDEAEMNRIATMHMWGNLGAVAIFALDFLLRFRLAEDSKIPLLLSLLGTTLIGVGGWLGGEMVYVKGMAVQAVDDVANKTKSNRVYGGLGSDGRSSIFGPIVLSRV